MHYFKFIAITLFVISCAPSSENDENIPSKDVLVENNEQNKTDDTLTNEVETNTIPTSKIESKTIQYSGYDLIIGESSKSEFDKITNTSTELLNEKECIDDKRIIIKTEYEIDLKLNDGTYFTLKKEKEDEQFFGYTLKHYDSNLNVYVLWENWLEAGHPIMVNGTTGKVTTILGYTFASNKNQTHTANVATDIGAGWTPNGLQVFEIENDNYYELFEFDPTLDLNETWGPVDLKWKNDNTIVLECIRHNEEGGYFTFYKVIQFKDLGKPDNFYR